MQRFVARIAEAVHNVGLKVTVGSASLKWNSDAGSAAGNFWSDQALMNAYASSKAYLDLYNIHYYDWMYDPSW